MHHHSAAVPELSDASRREPGHAALSAATSAMLHLTGAFPTISIKTLTVHLFPIAGKAANRFDASNES